MLYDARVTMRVVLFVLSLTLPHSGAIQREQHAVPKRPNILFLMSDSMDGRIVDDKAPEKETVNLPFLNGFLAKSGANFVRSYSNNPICTPSRASMMTGRRSDRINVWGNQQGLATSPAGVVDEACASRFSAELCRAWGAAQGNPHTILSRFQELGYRVHAEGKLHFGGALLNAAPHNHSVAGEMQFPAFDPFGLGHNSRSSDIRLQLGDDNRNAITTKIHTTGTDPPLGSIDWMTVQRCEDWIHRLPAPKKAVQPFFLHCSLNFPHYEYWTNRTWLAQVNVKKLKAPKWKEGFPSSYHPYDAYMSIQKGLAGSFTPAQIRTLQRVYLGMCAETDAMLSRIWGALVRKGYGLSDTYVVFVSDHGDMRFEHRQAFKQSMYESSVRVPLMLAGPGVIPGKRVEHLTSLLDLFPTLLDMAEVSNVRSYKDLDGMSLLSVAKGSACSAPTASSLSPRADTRNMVYSQYNWDWANTGAYMIRSGRWKCIFYGHTLKRYKNYAPQLFDVVADPDELQDVAASKPLLVKSLEKRLRGIFDIDAVDRKVMRDDFEFFSMTSDPARPEDVLKDFHQGYVGLTKHMENHVISWLAEMRSLFVGKTMSLVGSHDWHARAFGLTAKQKAKTRLVEATLAEAAAAEQAEDDNVVPLAEKLLTHEHDKAPQTALRPQVLMSTVPHQEPPKKRRARAHAKVAPKRRRAAAPKKRATTKSRSWLYERGA
eukprot:TRINITY_DN973_c0_g6_i1.p1 TRINITY_DN973_c0_g6~~TRINITY_DN973_c0_g6_i1.p1  ORF type:complete len:713 (-),score=157.82 TRINITY_DN973_c0_g6_i1:38-2176(-)